MEKYKLLRAFSINLFLLLYPILLICQNMETQKQRNRIGSTLEVYQVLKSDKTIKHGEYQKFLAGMLLEKGQYDHNKRVGLWEKFSGYGENKETGVYVNDHRAGVWDFFVHSEKIQSYNYSTKKLISYNTKKTGIEFIQTIVLEGKEIRDTMDIPSEMFGGAKKMLEILYSNLVYPTTARNKKIQGSVLVSFIVTPDGEMKDIQVQESSNQIFNKEALRAVSFLESETWIPGIYKGETVNIKCTLPVTFKIF